jgi:hypothetical protein
VVFGSDQLAKVFLGNVGLALVVNVQEQLATGQQFVDTKTPSFDGDGHYIK